MYLQVRDRSILMTLYGQFYSIGDDLTIADAGLVYVFVCFNDYEARGIVQSGLVARARAGVSLAAPRPTLTPRATPRTVIARRAHAQSPRRPAS